MSTLIVVFVVIVLLALGYFIYTGKLSAESFKSKVNQVTTLNDVLTQREPILNIAQSTNGLIGFTDPHPSADPNSMKQNILSKDLVTEDVIRNRYNELINFVQVDIPSGTGQGVQSKTIPWSEALGLFNAKDGGAFRKYLDQGVLKLIQDPTSGLTSIALTQETVNRAKTDPQLLQAIQLSQVKASVGSG